jgi:hypothetical protein
MRLKAKLEFEFTQCGTRAEFADSPFLNVSPLHLGDNISNHQDINDCMSSGGISEIDYREQNTLLDPELILLTLN